MLEPGDLVEIERGPYKHWAVYTGDDRLIHLTVGDEKKLNQLTACDGFVSKDKFNDVVGNCKWSKNNTLDRKYKPRSPAEYLKEAEEMVGKVIKYSLTTFNCEHFAKYLRYRNPESGQVQKVIEQVASKGPIAMSGVGFSLAVSRVSYASKSMSHSN